MNEKLTESSIVADVVTKYPHLRAYLEQLSIDYCCGGRNTLKQACEKAQLPLYEIINKLQNRIDEPTPNDSHLQDWTKASLTGLVEHIVEKHHIYLKQQFPRLSILTDKVYNSHNKNHGEMLQKLIHIFNDLRMDIEMHLEKEEQILFPMIKEIEAFSLGKGHAPTVHCGSIENPIRQMILEHDTAGDLLAEIRKITNNFQLPNNACESFKALYDGLEEMERDLHEHIHLENNILFPKSVQLEKSLNL